MGFVTEVSSIFCVFPQLKTIFLFMCSWATLDSFVYLYFFFETSVFLILLFFSFNNPLLSADRFLWIRLFSIICSLSTGRHDCWSCWIFQWCWIPNSNLWKSYKFLIAWTALSYLLWSFEWLLWFSWIGFQSTTSGCFCWRALVFVLSELYKSGSLVLLKSGSQLVQKMLLFHNIFY